MMAAGVDILRSQSGLHRARRGLRGGVARGRCLGSDRRATVALWIALTAPTLTMAMGMGIEVSNWAAIKVDLQRAADAAALGGVIYYNGNTGLANLAQKAATHAAYIAQLNGIAGTAAPTWTVATKTLADNLVITQIVSGVNQASDVAIKSTVSRTVASSFGTLFGHYPSTISASAVAEISTALAGPQPCILGLNGDQNGVTTDIDVALTGNANITANGCSVRSDGAITLSGNAQLNVNGTYAAGTISTSGNAQILGGRTPNAGQIPDPYANATALQNALTTAASATGTAISYSGGAHTLQPGTYASISASGQSSLALAPGLYTVRGNISLSGQSTLSASGVTIVSAGTLNLSGGTVSNFTAPTTSDASSTGGIAGVLYASRSSLASSFTGNAAVPFTGLLYYPNGNLRFTGNAADGAGGCSEIVASVVTFTGNANLGANCAQYGTLTYGSIPTTSTALVQ
jgi:Flp pilus assembly protein TadG